MNLKLDFDAIRKRIEIDKNAYKQGSWAKFVGVQPNIVSNIHGKIQQNPSFPYIISVAIATGKSVDYYLWGKEKNIDKQGLTPVIIEHQDLIKRYEDPVLGKEINEQLIDIQDTDKTLFQSAVNSIKSLWDTAMTIRQVKVKNPDKEKDLKNGTEGG